MKITLLTKCLCLIVFLAALGLTTAAQSPAGVDTKSKESLRGLDAMRVVVDIGDREERHGLSVAQIHEAAAAPLRKAGIRVVTKTEPLLIAGNPTLYVKLMVFRSGEVEYTWLTDVQLRQEVSPTRQPSVKEMAATWQNSAIGLFSPASPAMARTRITESVGSIVDWLIRDYQLVNAK